MIHDIIIFFCGVSAGLVMSSQFLRFLKNKRWLRISLTTKFYNDFSTDKCGVDPVKKVKPLSGIENI